MKLSVSKYFILAIIGAVILAVGLYLMLNNYFEKVEIIVAERALPADKVIEEEDISKVQYFKNSLPQGYITDENSVIGRMLTVPRQPHDPVTEAVFTDVSGQNITISLEATEVLIALNIDYVEPIAEKLVIGSRISIVSSQKDKDLEGICFQGNGPLMEIPEGSFIESSSFRLSKNILSVDGQIIIKNLEVMNLEKTEIAGNAGFSGSRAISSSIFIKCGIEEAPFIARVIKDNNYKIVLEKS